MLKLIALAIVALIAVVLIYAATRPDHFRIERSIRINAPADKVFALINDLHRHHDWSAWERIDPAMQRAHSGAASGVGAVYEWNGNKDVGQGRMEIIDSQPATLVRLKLDFIKPFEGHNQVDYSLRPEGDGTVVSQAMVGPSPYLSKLMGLVFNMGRMIGGKFEEGLANLKALAEAR